MYLFVRNRNQTMMGRCFHTFFFNNIHNLQISLKSDPFLTERSGRRNQIMRHIFLTLALVPLLSNCMLKKNSGKAQDTDDAAAITHPAECQIGESTSSILSSTCVAPVGLNIETESFRYASDGVAPTEDNKYALVGLQGMVVGINRSAASKSKGKEILDCICQATRSDNTFIYITSSSITANQITTQSSDVEKIKIDLFLEGNQYASACFDAAFSKLENFVRNGSTKWLGTATDIEKDPQPEQILKKSFCTSGEQVCTETGKKGQWLCHKKGVEGQFTDRIVSYFPLRISE